MECHQYLLAISGIEDSYTEWQHASHEVVAVAVHRLALWVVEAQDELKGYADRHQTDGESPMTAVDEQAIDDVELKHQAEEPKGTRPDDTIRVGQDIVEHAEHGNDVEKMVFVGTWGDVVEHGESHESYNHHLEEFQIMIADEAQRLSPVEQLLAIDSNKLRGILQVWLSLVFQYQSVCTQEEKYRHPIMSEEGDEVEGQVEVGIDHHLIEPIHVVLEILIFVLLDDRT